MLGDVSAKLGDALVLLVLGLGFLGGRLGGLLERHLLLEVVGDGDHGGGGVGELLLGSSERGGGGGVRGPHGFVVVVVVVGWLGLGV